RMDVTPVDSEGELVIDEREEGEIEDEEEREERRGMMTDIEEEEEDEDDEEEEIDVINVKEDEKERGIGSRMTLRPHSESKPLSSTSSCPSSLPSEMVCISTTIPSIPTSLSSSLMASGGLSSSLSSSSTVTSSMAVGAGANRMKWNIGDQLQFFEGVKQYGKDFDALHRVMARRNMGINKEQLRNFFFNFYRQVRSGAEMKEEDWSPDLSRDARDLFVVINGCEWRKRMGHDKFEPAKLKALILEGITVTRVRGKKLHVTIRTPCCPALLQFFSFNRRISRFPPDMVLYLSPRTFRDGTNVMSRGQSQHLCIRLNTCDRVERIFDLLHLKWRGETAYEEEDADGNEGESLRPFTVRLHPSKHTPMGEITFTPSPSSFGNISINMLQEDRVKTLTIKRQLKRGMELDSVCYRASQSLIPYLTITRDALLAGLKREDAGSASVAELYAVCGLSREVHLRYSIEETTTRAVEEPWEVLVQLLTRGYGEAATEKRVVPSAINRMPSRDDPIALDMEDETGNQPPQSKRSRPMGAMTSSSTARYHTGPRYITQQSPIVSKEMEDFEEQRRQLCSAPRGRRRSPVRQRKVLPPPSHPLSSSSPSSSSLLAPSRRTASSWSKTSSRLTASAASTPGQMPMTSSTTFPHMSATSPNDPMALALKAALTSPSNSLLDAPSSSQRRLVPAVVFASPSKTNSTLPFDVRAQMENCLNESSVEYCLQFSQFVNCTDISSSPSKLAKL
ncbi:hypothetical protein PENTCL1PPCAC_10599, partial [Pristionchus entomophagus]